MHVHPQSLPFTLPCVEYDELAGLLVQLAQEPVEVPEQKARYWPTEQSAEQLLQVYPLPALWLQDPERNLFAAQLWLSHTRCHHTAFRLLRGRNRPSRPTDTADAVL